MWTSSVWILMWRLSLRLWYISNFKAESKGKVNLSLPTEETTDFSMNPLVFTETLKENTWSFFLFLFFLGSWNFCFPDGHPDVSLGPKETQAVPEEILSGGAEKSSYDSYHLLSSSQELEPMCTVQELTQSKWAISFSNQSGSAEELLDIFLRKLTVQDEELLIKWKNVALEALVPAKRYDLIRFSVMELIGKGQENCLYWMLG